jgi:catechol 2,3-dioxygenase-like lactoylglutathione lyase family enzyme
VLLDGVNHVAIVTKDADRLVAFYREVFEAEVAGRQGVRGLLAHLHPHR